MSGDWRLQAACREVGGDVFFDKSQVLLAKQLCAGCPVRAACLEDALITDDNEYGVRGGLTPRPRLGLLRERRRAEKEAA